MELEIDIEDLLRKRNIESDRIEFKQGWNPDDIYHSVCAFANDYDNLGGGYIIIGVSEENGIAKRPVHGIPKGKIDTIQKAILGYNNLISPPYFPKVVVETVDGKYVIVLICRTGQQRPYKVPEHITVKHDKKYYYYIKYATSSIKANESQEHELINMTDHTPFDSRANQSATIEDISPILLEDHLRKTNSKLAPQLRKRGVEEILNDMQLFIGPQEHRYLQNVAIMMFCEHPEKFFMYTQVQMTVFPEGSIKNPNLSEDFPTITGSVPQMIEATLNRFKTSILKEKVIKTTNKAEAIRAWNYPYQAIEEAVVNAFYHRDYTSNEPITIEIEPDCINIMNFPGIDRSISDKTISEGERFVTRYYRNRRLGEFLKELDLSEGHSSGIPTIQEALKNNGSPRAEFYTDPDRRALRVKLPIHPAFIGEKIAIKSDLINNGVENGVESGVESGVGHIEKIIIEQIKKNSKISQKQMSENIGVPYRTLQRTMKQMMNANLLKRVGPAKGGYWEIID